LTATLPTAADGGPFESPMHWRPVLGARFAQAGYLPGRPVKCGVTNKDLYDGYEEPFGSGDSVVCIDAPSPAATRGFLAASLTDFGILGSTVQAPAGSTVTAPFIAKRSGPADPGTTFSLSTQGGVPGGSLSLDRGTVSLGGDSTQLVLATIGVPAGTAAGSYPATLTATAPGKPTRTGTVTVVVPGPPSPPPPPANVAPKIESASLTPKRFLARKPKGAKGGPPVGAKLKVTLSEAAILSVKIEKVKGKSRKVLQTPTKNLGQGQSTIPIRGGKLLDVKLKPGHYRLTLTARDDGGLNSESKPLEFDLLRSAPAR
jgi:hypothetical protein